VSTFRNEIKRVLCDAQEAKWIQFQCGPLWTVFVSVEIIPFLVIPKGCQWNLCHRGYMAEPFLDGWLQSHFCGATNNWCQITGDSRKGEPPLSEIKQAVEHFHAYMPTVERIG
jgi:hypothetical protein